MKVKNMKAKSVVGALALLLTALVPVACHDDESVVNNDMIVTIGPEAELEGTMNPYYYITAMRLTAADGQALGMLSLKAIDGFTYEEGYRYRLKIRRIHYKEDEDLADGNWYRETKLLSLISREQVGVKTTGQRIVTLRVRPVLVKSTAEAYNVRTYLAGRIEETGEQLDMVPGEVMFMPLKYEKPMVYRARVSITPTDEPTNRVTKRKAKIRFIEMLEQKEMPADSVVVGTYLNMEE